MKENRNILQGVKLARMLLGLMYWFDVLGLL